MVKCISENAVRLVRSDLYGFYQQVARIYSIYLLESYSFPVQHTVDAAYIIDFLNIYITFLSIFYG